MPSEGSDRVTLVAAYADGRIIGDAGSIPWHISEDFAHFKAVTMGGVLVMGRATWDSIGRPLPGRTTIVLTRSTTWQPGFDGVLVAHSLDEALGLAASLGEVFVVGGAQVYELALPRATHQVLTEVDLAPPGDARYPVFPLDEWTEVRRESRPDLGLDWVWWERVSRVVEDSGI
ncbi:dihydrofolate reductase [Nocardioides sp. CF8]|uniref:dihydrofolate reductase n=1 Tax=Nocardioides sp. CF8 TaxID=110319 RepID=UPI00033077F9|nr:dihydrofolate reductase [Nocardioides sp. CF8]EON23591.1 dihydrofolate reductase [Nocardioides sp. CF8]